MLRIERGIEGAGPLVHHVHERLLDEHRGHHAYAQFEEQGFAVGVPPEEVHVTFHLPTVIFPLKERVRTDPRLHRVATMRTAGYQRFRQCVVFNLAAKFVHLLFIVIDVVVARMLALPIAPVSLQACDFFLWECPVELRILIGGNDVILLSFQQLC